MLILPIKAVSKFLSYRFYWLTILIILINIGVFSVYNMGLVPDADFGKLIFFRNDLSSGRYYSVLTAMFAHANLAHLFGNMYFFWIFGSRLEKMVGIWRFLLIYIGGGVIATLTFLPFAGQTLAFLGASGAIFAVMGAYLVMLPKDDIKFFAWLFIRYYTFTVPAWVAVGYYFIINLSNHLINSQYSNVAYGAHVLGLLAGIGLGSLLYLIARDKRRIFGKVIFLSVSDGSREFLEKAFLKKKWNVVSITTVDEFNKYLVISPVNAILIDYDLFTFMGPDYFAHISAEKNNIPVVVLANHPTVKYWMEEYEGKQYQFLSGKLLPQLEIVRQLDLLAGGGKLRNDVPAQPAITNQPVDLNGDSSFAISNSISTSGKSPDPASEAVVLNPNYIPDSSSLREEQSNTTD